MKKNILSLLLAITLIFSGCSSKKEPDVIPEPDTTTTKKENISCYLTPGENLNPLFADTENDISIYSLIYDSLIYLDSNMTIVPQLAESCSVASDCKSITFTLRNDVLWHDGVPFTANDVKHTIDTIKNSEQYSPYSDALLAVSDVEISDDYHFTLLLSGAYARIVNLLDFPIIPEHATNIDKVPLGTGRYKYESGDNKEINLVKNNLWKLGDLPAQQNIKIKLLGKSTNQFSLFKTGEIDLMTVSLHQMSAFGVTNKLKYVPYVTPKYEFIGFNFSNRVLADSAVRKAIKYALNRDEIINEAYLGMGSQVCAPIMPTSYFYNSDADDVIYSPEKAKQILEEAGWRDVDGDNIADKDIDGILYSLKATLLVNDDNPMRIAAAKKISSFLSTCGFSATISEVSWETYKQRLSDDDYAMFLGGTEIMPSFDYSFFLSKWAIDNSQNYMNYSSEDMDKAISKTMTAVSMDECKAAYLDFQYVFSRDLPVVGIMFQHNHIIYQDGIEGVNDACFSSPLINFNTWYRK